MLNRNGRSMDFIQIPTLEGISYDRGVKLI